MHSSRGHRRTAINCERLPTIIAQAVAEVQAVKLISEPELELYWKTNPAKIKSYFKSWPAALKRMRLDQEVLPEPSWTANCGFGEDGRVQYTDRFEGYCMWERGAVERKVMLGDEYVGVKAINLPSLAASRTLWFLVYIDRRYVVAYRPDDYSEGETFMYLLGDSLEEGYTNLLLACSASDEERPRYARRVDAETGNVLHHADDFV